jgi:hypothetical protein
MSLGEELHYELLAHIDGLYHKIKSEAESGIWTTRSGEKIDIHDMSNNHIKNALAMVEKLNKDSNDMMFPWEMRFKQELRNRGVKY